MNQPADTYTFRFAQPHQVGAVHGFYADNPHHGVYTRAPEIVEDRVNKGFFQIVTDRKDSIVAATASYPLNGNKHHEVGSTRSILSGGFYELLIGIQMVQALVKEPPKQFVMADVQTSLTGVIRRLTGPILGWQEFTPDTGLVQGFKSTVAKEDTNVNREKLFFRAPVSALPQVADHLLQHMKGGTVTGKDGQVFGVAFALPFAHILEPLAARKDEWRKLPPDASWQKASQELLASVPPQQPSRPARRMGANPGLRHQQG